MALTAVIALGSTALADVRPEMVKLGEMLFFDPVVSGTGQISCSSCHDVVMAEESPLRNPRRQVKFAIGATKAGSVYEMGNSEDNLVTTLKKLPEYGVMFRRAFPGLLDPINIDYADEAVAAFLEPMTASPSPFIDNCRLTSCSAFTSRMRGELFFSKRTSAPMLGRPGPWFHLQQR